MVLTSPPQAKGRCFLASRPCLVLACLKLSIVQVEHTDVSQGFFSGTIATAAGRCGLGPVSAGSPLTR